MPSQKTIVRVFSVVSILFLLTSILTIEFQQVDGFSKLKYPVCVDTGIELATNGQQDSTPVSLDAMGAVDPPEAEHCISRRIASFHEYRAPPLKTLS